MNEHMAANLLSSRISKPVNIIHGGVSFLLFPLVFPGALYVVAGYVDEALCLLILQGGKNQFQVRDRRRQRRGKNLFHRSVFNHWDMKATPDLFSTLRCSSKKMLLTE